MRRAGSALGARTVMEHMRGKVASWRMPDDIVFVDQMPLTATGKIHKLTLRQRFKDYRMAGSPDAS